MFQNANQNLGKVKEGTKRIIKYPFTNIASIDEVKTACTCSIGEVNTETNELELNYTAAKVPPHLFGQGWYTACIKTTVIFKPVGTTAQTKQILTFTVTVTNGLNGS